MNWARIFFREHSLRKVAAVYTSAAAARAAEIAMQRMPRMRARQVQIVYPFDPDWARKVEPEGVGIWRTALRAHLSCGSLGFATGIVLFAALYALGTPAVSSTPLQSLVAFTLFATMFGLMAGGALTIRPDHDHLIEFVRDAARQGHWAVVVHPVSRRQRDDAVRTLATMRGPVARTF